jgi:hypothetical protein
MATTLPSLTRTIDDTFVTTWYEIRPEAIDNILDATVIWAAMRMAGSFTPQVGGEFITRTVRYGEQDAVAVQKGDLLSSGEPELETMARWEWKHLATHVQRDVVTDQKNAGPSKIKDYVAQRLEAARDGLEQKLETQTFGTFSTTESGAEFQHLNDLCPELANRSTGTYGGITRASAYSDGGVPPGATVETPTAAATNPWWGCKYLDGELNDIATELLIDMRQLYNSLHNNQSPPNLIITTQTIFETYEEFASDAIQIIKDETTMLADLGFEVLRFKGKPMVWTPNVTANNVVMLNLDYVEVVYDPNLWFDMTDFKPIPLQMDRIAHILSAVNIVGAQPRRHGRLVYA